MRYRPGCRGVAEVKHIVAVLPLMLLAVSGTAPAPEPVRLGIALAGLRSSAGEVRLCIWHSPERYKRGKCEGDSQSIVVAAAETMVEVPLAPGDYAVSLVHDENGNGQARQEPVRHPDRRRRLLAEPAAQLRAAEFRRDALRRRRRHQRDDPPQVFPLDTRALPAQGRSFPGGPPMRG